MASLRPRSNRGNPIRVRLVVGEIAFEIQPYRDAIVLNGNRVPSLVYDPAPCVNKGRIIITHHTSNAMLGEAIGEAIRLGVNEMLRRREGVRA